jgi:type IV pilus assembly protein PilY1
LAATLAFLVGFGPMSPITAYAATAALADSPINVNIKAKPNIVYTMDDSTSMLLPFLPDYVVVDSGTNAATAFCRSATGALTACGSVGSGTIPQYMYAEWIPGAVGAAGSFPYPSGYGNSSYGPPAVMTSSFNAMFYNPQITYVAPPKYDGTSYPNMNAANTTNYTKVPADPYLFPAKFVNLQTKVNVGVWCNTTYAGNFTLPNGVAADRDGIAIGGDHCRINGWTYAAGANGAPAVKGDYNYPYARNVATNPIANFFSITSRTIYCDPNKMNGSTVSGSADKAPKDPTCVACTPNCQAPAKMVEDPTSPAGCTLGCTNPAECIVCNKKCDADLTYNCSTTCTTPALSCPSGNSWPKSASVTCPDGANEKCQPNPGACATADSWKLDSAACTTVINGKSKTAGAVPAGTIGKTYEQDANYSGDVCRRNNFTYADGTNGGWSVPGGAYTQAVGCSGSITAAINRHYYKAQTQWCTAQIGTGTDDKWRGYGTTLCRAEKGVDEATGKDYKFPRFFKAGVYAEADYNTVQDNYGDNAAFELVELDYKNNKIIVRNGTPTTSITHTLDSGDTITRDVASSTPEASEFVNYANWFAYYRTRILAAKTVTALAFSDLTDKFRVGFHTLSNSPASSFLTINDFAKTAGGHRDLWYGRLQNTAIGMGKATPLLDGMVRIGEWFKASSGTSPDLSGSTNPITLSCQKNYHMMFTDGYTNQAGKPAFTVGNIDGAVIPAKTDDVMPVEIKGMEAGKEWPRIVREKPASPVTDSLSDYALYYWHKDLRPPSFDKSVSENNVPATDIDPAQWQHLNFAALSLGTQGKLPSRNTTTTETAIRNGTAYWTPPAPNVYQPGTTGVDDLWHSAHAGFSQFVNARDPAELQTGLQRILKEIENQQASRAGAAFSSVNFSASGNYVYRVTIEPGWGGTLSKVEIDAKGGGEKTTPEVEYHTVLGKQVDPIETGKSDPWFSNRNVITFNPTTKAAVPFRYDDMPSSLRDTLGKDEATRKAVIAYLRGDRSNEGDGLKNFRKRAGVLGDIVSSSPVVVGPPSAPYSDATDPDYEAFKETYKGRKKMVYVGANDGMLHAFDEATGKEVWAYIPSFVYDSAADKGLAMLAKKEPFFKHQMFVDSTPVAADVKVDGSWRTYLFGGLGKGGKGYYAIDITDPASIEDEADAAANVKWEYSGAAMGYSYGKPLIGKTHANGWVAIFTSGYNATDKAAIHVVDLKTGTVIGSPLKTTVDGDAGLAQVSGFVLSFKNQYIEQIYGGDLLGNVWRFDVHHPSAGDWKVEKLATLTSTDSTAQGVTTAPQIEIDLANGVDRYVMIGTGRLLHEDDLETYKNQVQTMYVIRDGTALQHNNTGLPHNPRTDSGFTSVSRSSIAGFSGLSIKGWYQDLPAGERIISPIAAELNLLGWSGALPPENECLPGLAANLYVRDFPHGGSQLLDEDGDPTAWIFAEEGAVGMEFVNIYSETPNDPTLKLAITLGTTGKTIYIDLVKNSTFGDHRMSWRLLGQ